jgi:hypothetical protein
VSHEQSPQPNPIAALNDAFRQQFHDWYLTQGAAALPARMLMLKAVRDYNRFTPDNDPYGEHDFGGINWHDDTVVLWKIDYYDQNLQYWCDPLSEECRRVLTVLLASEY